MKTFKIQRSSCKYHALMKTILKSSLITTCHFLVLDSSHSCFHVVCPQRSLRPLSICTCCHCCFKLLLQQGAVICSSYISDTCIKTPIWTFQNYMSKLFTLTGMLFCFFILMRIQTPLRADSWVLFSLLLQLWWQESTWNTGQTLPRCFVTEVSVCVALFSRARSLSGRDMGRWCNICFPSFHVPYPWCLAQHDEWFVFASSVVLVKWQEPSPSFLFYRFLCCADTVCQSPVILHWTGKAMATSQKLLFSF